MRKALRSAKPVTLGRKLQRVLKPEKLIQGPVKLLKLTISLGTFLPLPVFLSSTCAAQLASI